MSDDYYTIRDKKKIALMATAYIHRKTQYIPQNKQTSFALDYRLKTW